MLGHDDLTNYFRTNFALMHHHKYSLSDIENLIPWERQLYIDMLSLHLKQLEQQMRDQAAVNRRR